MVHQELANLLCLLQIFWIQCLTIHHRVPIESPSLTARPRTAVSIALSRIFGMRLACNSIVADNMEGREVRTEVILHRGIRMLFSDTLILAVTRLPSHETEHLKIHHIINDDRVLPAGITIPRLDDTQFIIPTGQQTLSTLIDHIHIMLVARQAIALSETAIEHKAQIVGVSHLFRRFHTVGVHFGQLAQLLILAL